MKIITSTCSKSVYHKEKEKEKKNVIFILLHNSNYLLPDLFYILTLLQHKGNHAARTHLALFLCIQILQRALLD